MNFVVEGNILQLRKEEDKCEIKFDTNNDLNYFLMKLLSEKKFI